MHSLALTCLCFSLAIALSAGRFFRTTVTPSNVTCTPRHHVESCGDVMMMGENTAPVTEGFGPNVCEVATEYQVQTLLYVETEFCYGSRCRTFCTATSNCTGPMKNFTRTQSSCCDGFAVDEEEENSFPRFRYHRRRSVLREKGCTIALSDSLAVCLLDLNLESFAAELIADAPEVIPVLGNGDSDDHFTLFALEGIDESIDALGYVVNGTVDKKQYTNVFSTLRENVFLHVVQGADRKTLYVNGVEIEELKACQARNGLVHRVSSPIPQSDITITQTLRDDPRFSTFVQLLNGANISMFLDEARKSRTVLAPTNEAFDALPANAVECLLRPENRRYLNKVVYPHISFPAEYSSTLSQRRTLCSFDYHYYLPVSTEEDGSIFITNDQIPLEEVDIPANNGVIHVIPQVIIPSRINFDRICEEDGSGELTV